MAAWLNRNAPIVSTLKLAVNSESQSGRLVLASTHVSERKVEEGRALEAGRRVKDGDTQVAELGDPLEGAGDRLLVGDIAADGLSDVSYGQRCQSSGLAAAAANSAILRVNDEAHLDVAALLLDVGRERLLRKI